MPIKGFYINLDRSPDRRREIEAELARFGLQENYRRFRAIDGNALGLPNPRLNSGEMGCFLSHYMLLKYNLGSDDHLHIIEDDAVFAASTATFLEKIISTGEIDRFDIIYTDVAIPLSNEAYKNFKTLYDNLVTRKASGAIESAAFQILGLNKWMATTNSSYIVNKSSIEKIHRLYHEALTAGAILPVDNFLRRLAETGALKAGFVFPFITSVRPERAGASTVRKVPDTTLKFTAADIARYSFFIGCDWNECEALFERLIPVPAPEDRHANLLTRVLASSLVSDADKVAMASEGAVKIAKAS